MSANNTDLAEYFLRDYHTWRNNANGKESFLSVGIREQAAGYFLAAGFPTIRHEEWKYTNLMPALRHQYTVAEKSSKVTAHEIQRFTIPTLKASVLVFVNGLYEPKLSRVIHNQVGVTVSNCVNTNPEVQQSLLKYYGSLTPVQNDAVAALNVAASRDGVFIHIAANTIVEDPIYILCLNDSQVGNTFSQLHNVIILERGSSASIIQDYHTLTNDNSVTGFSNIITEITLRADARLQHYTLQNDIHQSTLISGTYIHQDATSVYKSCVFSLGGGLVRNNLTTTLAGKAADAHLYGLSLLNDTMLVDHHTMVDHAVAHCTSNELYKCILDDRSTGVFNGKIIVRQDAQKTLAYQSSRNILLSGTATMNTKPQLEIFADDVKCSHGAATGQLEEDMLFYLRARGIPESEAKTLLLQGFAGEILQQVEIPALREWLESQVLHRLTPENKSY